MNRVDSFAVPHEEAQWRDVSPVDRNGINCWLEVDQAAFEGNVRALRRSLAGRSELCVVMKADAYGHGLQQLMPSVIRSGVTVVGVADNSEARVVRASGFTKRLLRMRVAGPGEIADGLEYGMEEMLGNLEDGQGLSELAGHHRRPIAFHLALNSGGMSRYGLEMSNGRGRDEALEILCLPDLRIVGIMTHFPVRTRDDVLRGFTKFQAEAGWVIEQGGLDARRLTLHCANSFTTMRVPEARLDMVRCGGLLYQPLESGTQECGGFRRVAQFKSRVGSVNTYPFGNTVCYDRTFVLRRDSRLASVPVGFSDGFRSKSDARCIVLIQGRRVPVVGKGTMNAIMVDVTDHPAVRSGDEVVLFGRQGDEEITLEEFSNNLGCPTWEEMATCVGNLNPRVLLA